MLASGPDLATHKASVALSHHLPGSGLLSNTEITCQEHRETSLWTIDQQTRIPDGFRGGPWGGGDWVVSGCLSWPTTCSPGEGTGEFLSVYVVTKLPRWQTWVLQLHSVSEAN